MLYNIGWALLIVAIFGIKVEVYVVYLLWFMYNNQETWKAKCSQFLLRRHVGVFHTCFFEKLDPFQFVLEAFGRYFAFCEQQNIYHKYYTGTQADR